MIAPTRLPIEGRQIGPVERPAWFAIDDRLVSVDGRDQVIGVDSAQDAGGIALSQGE